MQIFIWLQKTQYTSFQLLENGTKNRKTSLFSTYMRLERTSFATYMRLERASFAEAQTLRLKNVTY